MQQPYDLIIILILVGFALQFYYFNDPKYTEFVINLLINQKFY